MARHLTWSFKSPHRLALDGAGCPIELRYEAAGFDSGWLVLVDGQLAARCPDLTAAQDSALVLAGLPAAGALADAAC